MRNIIKIALLLGLLLCSACQDDYAQDTIPMEVKTKSHNYTEIQVKALMHLYSVCWEFYEEALTPLFQKKDTPEIVEQIQVIKYVDWVLDNNGDFLCEIPDYDEIKSIIWPNGYGV